MKTLRIFFLSALLLCTFTANAQTWDDMVRWLRNDGMETLASLAHPYDYANDKVVRYNFVRASSSSVVIEITYRGFIFTYTDTYEIVRGNYNGSPYFRTVRVSEMDDPLFKAFNGIDNFGYGYELGYMRAHCQDMYGGSDFQYLSRYDKAAFALFAIFLSQY